MARETPFFIALPVNPKGSTTDSPAIRSLAGQVRAGLDEDAVTCEAIRFLDFIAEGKGIECGRKGQLLTWGYVANYGSAERTAKELAPFWEGLYRLPDQEGMAWYDRALIFSQDEENMPIAVQVRLDEDTGRLVLSKAELTVSLREV